MRENKGQFGKFYKIEKILGLGTFSEVRRCESVYTGSKRAVKVINKKHMKRKDDIKRFLYEVDTLKDLDHPSVLKIYEYFNEEDRLFIVTEYVSGNELLAEVNKRKNSKELFFSEGEAALIIKQVLTVLNYCHKKNIVHRDVKLENIMIESKPTKEDPEIPWQIKLIDFGTAMKFRPGMRIRQTFGTSSYIAPEVLEGNYNEKCDVWSAGIVLYILLSGE